MSKPLRVRRLTPEEGQLLQRIVRRGGGKTDKSHVKWRRALVVHAFACGNTVPAIANLVVTSEDRVPETIHRSNELGMRSPIIARREHAHGCRVGAQLTFAHDDGHPFQVYITDLTDDDVPYLEALYSGGGRVERRICDAKDTSLDSLPSASMAINQA